MASLNLSSRYPLVLLVVAAALLIVGVAIRPEPKKAIQVSESELARLQELTSERRLSELSKYLRAVADRAASHLVFLTDSSRTAVVWPDGSRLVSTLDNRAGPVPDDLPFSTFDFTASEQTKPKFGKAEPGDWVIAVALTREGKPIYSYGSFHAGTTTECGTFSYQRINSAVPLSPAMVGGGIFTMRGELLGAISACEDRLVVISWESIRAALNRPVVPNDALRSRFGMEVRDSASDKPAVQVSAVWLNGAADRSGIAVGDLVVEVASKPVSTAADLASAAAQVHNNPLDLTIVRGRRRFPVKLDTPAQRFDTEIGAIVKSTHNRVEVEHVKGASLAERAGVERGDVLLKVSGTEVRRPEDAVRLLSRPRTDNTLTVQRGGSELTLLIAQ